MTGGILYIFLDEGGNFDFSVNGTAWFTFSAVTKQRPFGSYARLIDLKYDLLEEGMDVEFFHASEDKQIVRDRVFAVIQEYMSEMSIDCVVVEKRKVGPALRPVKEFYPRMLGHLQKYIFQRLTWQGVSEVIVVTDQILVKKLIWSL